MSLSLDRVSAVAMGASAGAVEALSTILPQLPASFRCPILIVVHVPPDGKSLLSELFSARCRVVVKEAESTEPIQPGTVYFAPPGYHLQVEPNFRISLSVDAPVLYSRPSIDVLFETAADAYRESLLGIVLSGANSDGSGGLRAIVDAGGQALVQSPVSASAGTMPMAALARCPDACVLDPEQIGKCLASLGGERG